MLARRQRLARTRIEYLLKKGKKLDTDLFRAKYLSTNRDCSRFCVVISTKTEAKAVKRNLVRRRIYEASRLNQHLLTGPCDIIFITKPSVLKIDYEGIKNSIINFFNTINKIK